MTLDAGQGQEVFELMEALCEDRISRDQADRLEQIVLGDQAARQVYLSYLDLHGTLYWDAATGAEQDTSPVVLSEFTTPVPKRRRDSVVLLVSACVVLFAIGLVSAWTYLGTNSRNGLVVNGKPDRPQEPDKDGRGIFPSIPSRPPLQSNRHFKKLTLPERAANQQEPGNRDKTNEPSSPQSPSESYPRNVATRSSSLQKTVAFIDGEIRKRWKQHEVTPSAVADDAEWFRRSHLDIVGHISTADDVVAFLKDKNPDKRSHLVDRLLDDSDYVRNWTTIWTNLLIGHSNDGEVNRPALQKYLRESFARNFAWDQMVHDFISAEGSSEENGATNFLLAHLNNQAVPATAITARLFMGIQVHCTQCHDHPFHDDWKQNQFWELHSFFQQTAKSIDREHTIKPVGQKRISNVTLVSEQVGGPIYYETRRGVMRVAFPTYEGVSVDPKASVNRRQKLATLMTSGDKPPIAEAIVNRMWGHFFGYGFTRGVDDMGPHNPAVHPELLDRLAREFVKSGYDLKQLIRWICNSEAYQLSSRFGPKNQEDDPAVGSDPLFSHMYVKSMTAEQLFDSLLIATRTHHAWGSDWAEVERKRQEWLQQFVIALQTDENDEAMTFDGTIPQALMMMNSELIQQALSVSRGTYLSEVVRKGDSEVEKIERICLATLSRYPNARELSACRKLLRQNPARRPAGGRSGLEALQAQGFQDILWAYLNSSEFILVY